MQGATLVNQADFCYVGVSIHAPYAGSDVRITNTAIDFLVSIHAPYAGSDFDRYA